MTYEEILKKFELREEKISSNELTLFREFAERKDNNITYKRNNTPTEVYDLLTMPDVDAYVRMYIPSVMQDGFYKISQFFYEPNLQYPRQIAIDMTDILVTDEYVERFGHLFNIENLEVKYGAFLFKVNNGSKPLIYMIVPWCSDMIKDIVILDVDNSIKDMFYIPESYIFYTREHICELFDNGQNYMNENNVKKENKTESDKTFDDIIMICYPKDTITDFEEDILVDSFRTYALSYPKIYDYITKDNVKSYLIENLNTSVYERFPTGKDYREFMHKLIEVNFYLFGNENEFKDSLVNYTYNVNCTEPQSCLLFAIHNTALTDITCKHSKGDTIFDYGKVDFTVTGDYRHNTNLIFLEDDLYCHISYNKNESDIARVLNWFTNIAINTDKISLKRIINLFYNAVGLLVSEGTFDMHNYNLEANLEKDLGMTKEEIDLLFNTIELDVEFK